MGAGTLIELVARGKQDIYLIGNPNYSYFKTVYHRHTNFSLEPVRNIFNETPDFGKRVTCFIDKKGDLLNSLFLEIELPALKEHYSWCNGVGNFMIDYVEVQFGGQPIDRISGQLMDVWNEVTVDIGVKNSYYSMVGKYATFNDNIATDKQLLFIPIPFWFCRKISQSLPLIAMQYTDVSIVVQFKPFDYCIYTEQTEIDKPSTQHITSAYLYADYIFLDTYERQKFAARPEFDMLIEQFQEFGGINKIETINNISAPFYFNHPVKELLWIYQSDYAQSINIHNDYTTGVGYNEELLDKSEAFYSIQLKFNGNDRFDERRAPYFRLVQPYQRHSYGTREFIYVWSFAVNPEDIQPSGTCNFSKIDDAKFIFKFKDVVIDNPYTGSISIYATNYNILKIESGMAGVLFS
jgi:hypothetical protein